MQALGRCTVSLLPHFFDDISTGDLVARPIRQPVLTQTLYLLRSRRRSLDKAQTLAYGLIKLQIAHVIRQGLYRWHAPGWGPARRSVEL
jgi:hypothetical protein